MFLLKDAKYKKVLHINRLDIASSQVTCLLGKSGSGKTTLLKLLNNLISCDEGTIYYENRNIEEIDPVQLRREVIMLPQAPIIFPGTVKDNLLIGLQFSQKPHADDNTLKLMLKKMKLFQELHHDTGKLSGGEKQRLAICRVMLMEPEVFLLDEPTSSLDDETGDTVINYLVQTARQNKKSIIMATHARSIARKYGDTIITLDHGKVGQVQKVVQSHG